MSQPAAQKKAATRPTSCGVLAAPYKARHPRADALPTRIEQFPADHDDDRKTDVDEGGYKTVSQRRLHDQNEDEPIDVTHDECRRLAVLVVCANDGLLLCRQSTHGRL